MRVNFRQGIVSNVVTSTFQVGSPNFITLNVPNPNFPVLLTFADGNFNYLHAFRLSRPDAWGPLLGGIDAYLYVDINKPTGAVSFGSSALNPVTAVSAPGFVSPTPPVSPVIGDLWKNSVSLVLSYWTGSAWADANDQHWFDMLNRQMKVWNSATLSWLPKVRVFVGKLALGALPLISMSINAGLPSNNVSYYLGTQIGDSTPNEAGYILFSGGQALVRSDGSFLTTVDVLIAEGVQESSPITYATNTLAAVASTSIPAFSMVSFNAPGEIGLMTDLDMNSKVYGIVVQPAGTGNTVTVITAGIINVPTTSIVGGPGTVNAPLYVNGTGQLTLTRPASAPDPVAAVVNPTPSTVMIYLLAADVLVPSDLIDASYVNVAGDTMTGTLIMSSGAYVLLNSLPTIDTHATSKVYVDASDAAIDAALTAHTTDNAIHLSVEQNTFLDLLDAAAPGIVVKDAEGSMASRTVTSTLSTITVTNGTGVAGNINVDLPLLGTASTYKSVTTDAQGRVTAGTNPTTLAGYGIVDAQALDATLTSLAAVAGVQGDLLYATGADTWARLAKDATATRYLSNTGGSNNPAWAQINLANGVTGTLLATNGGTNTSVYAVGDLLYADTTTSLAKLAGVATGNVLISGGVSTAPTWGKVGLTTHVSGILPIANGGTAVSTVPTNGQLLIGNGTGYAVAALTAGAGVSVTNGVGSVTVATQTLKGSAAFTFGAIAVNDVGTSTNTLTVTGAVAGDVVNLGLPSTVPAGFTYVGYVSAADTVTIRAHGSAASGTGAGAADATINVIVMKYASF